MRLLLFIICSTIVTSTVNSATAVHPSIFLINPVQPPIDIIRPVYPNIYVDITNVPVHAKSSAVDIEFEFYQQKPSQRLFN